jgi:hypothetical protein
MKKILMYAAGFVFIAVSFSSCQKNCKVCQQNTYRESDGSLLTTGSETEYCDLELITIEGTKEFTVAGVTTRWVCR